MTDKPVAVPLDVTLAEAAKIMRDHAIGDVLVTSNGQLCGVLTDRDIVVRAVAESRDPRRTSVGDVCSADIATIDPDADADEAAALMRSRAVRRLPVVNSRAPVGIVSMSDLAMDGDGVLDGDWRSVLADISKAPPNR
jgi:CBS domain-containing protein